MIATGVFNALPPPRASATCVEDASYVRLIGGTQYSSAPTGSANGAFEVYDEGRYFVFTGKDIAGTPTTIEERQAELDAVSEMCRHRFPFPRT